MFTNLFRQITNNLKNFNEETKSPQKVPSQSFEKGSDSEENDSSQENINQYNNEFEDDEILCQFSHSLQKSEEQTETSNPFINHLRD